MEAVFVKMRKPVRYDGHACDHEILHRNLSNDLNYEENLVRELQNSNTVITDINLYTLYNAHNHFQILREEFPNIEHIILTADTGSFDSVTYSDRFDLFCPEHLVYPTMDRHKFTVTFDWKRFKKKKKMMLCDYYQNLKFLKGLYWSGNDIGVYLSTNFAIVDSEYSHWHKSLAQYYPISEVNWDNLISSVYRPGPPPVDPNKQGWL